MERQEQREEENEKWKVLNEPLSDFADAAAQMEESERRKLEEEERIHRRELEQEERKRRLEEQEQISRDMEVVRIYLEEVLYFQQMLEEKQRERQAYEEARKLSLEQAKMERQIRQAQKKEEKQGNKWRFGIR